MEIRKDGNNILCSSQILFGWILICAFILVLENNFLHVQSVLGGKQRADFLWNLPFDSIKTYKRKHLRWGLLHSFPEQVDFVFERWQTTCSLGIISTGQSGYNLVYTVNITFTV